MSKLTWKWRKCQNTSFNAYKASGVYNFYYFFEEGKSYDIIPVTSDKGKTVQYQLREIHQKVYESATYNQELGTFKTSLEAKNMQRH